MLALVALVALVALAAALLALLAQVGGEVLGQAFLGDLLEQPENLALPLQTRCPTSSPGAAGRTSGSPARRTPLGRGGLASIAMRGVRYGFPGWSGRKHLGHSLFGADLGERLQDCDGEGLALRRSPRACGSASASRSRRRSSSSSSSEAVGFSSALAPNLELCVDLGMPAVGVDLALQVVAGELFGAVPPHDQPVVAVRARQTGAEVLRGLELLGREARITTGARGNANVA